MSKRPKKQAQRWFLKEWRKYRGLTQDQLADRADLSKGFISNLESGGREYTQATLEQLAEALRCEPADLLMRDPSKADSLWSIYDALSPPERQQAVQLIRVITGGKTGTDD